MAINYADSAKQIVELIGGDSNVISVTHCATRLRFVLKEMGRVDKEVFMYRTLSGKRINNTV
ncbi:PTS transporter subunit EIIB [Aeromonas caviae]|uniref:PTS transporter subunit EIIB n=1 Tax=Aeromonas caviae TaxID=648 RepID=UPI001CC4A112|nr:PTS transporter subunit EIIB [Aeromonas caviae]GJA85734.1 hypothetical protein KAM356_17930 [Aeromonas caviae]GJA89604.1 hypothetical protein KAM357_15520 [Aeromonas caviae]GJB06983.1 hypothetical protein KAM361_16560 [Aeromonas caviae]GJB16912.1 hypothetical protein KAM363_29170 [Aeromonas caviae]GJB36840.1 hypothetical protein KAM368_14070 [Aeromonas caviae]